MVKLPNTFKYRVEAQSFALFEKITRRDYDSGVLLHKATTLKKKPGKV